MARANRQMKLLEIITKNEIFTQEELVEHLIADGYQVTQATVSRDINDMNIYKGVSSDGKHYKYVTQPPKDLSSSDKFLRMFRNIVLSIKCSENLIVLKTEAGSAGPAAALIDKLNFADVLGVIAGDDTIFVAVDGIENTDLVLDKLSRLLV